MPFLIFERRRGSWVVTVIENGVKEIYSVNSALIDDASVTLGRDRAMITTLKPCRWVKVKVLGKEEDVLACTDASDEEIRNKVKFV